jgi:hypothetical protein
VLTPEIHKFLEATGFRSSAFDRIRFSRGIIGKASYVAVAAMLALGIVAYNLREPMLLLAIGLLIVFLFVAFFVGTLWFANKHPGPALLEGAELIQWRQMETTASNPPESIDRELIEPVPQIEDQERKR